MAFKPVEEKNNGGKFLIFGGEHTGKSWFSQTFPRSGVVDGELSQAFDAGEEIVINGVAYNNVIFVDDTLDLDELEEDLDTLIEGDIDIDTFVIDGESKFYQVMEIGSEEAEEKKAKENGKSVDARAKWGRVKTINMKLQQAKITASARGCHIVSIAQEATITEDIKVNGKVEQKIIGYRPETNKKLPHDYDVIIRFVNVKDEKTGKITERYGEVYKDRTHVTQPGDILHNCTFDMWKPLFDKRKAKAKGKKSDINFSKDIKNSTKTILNDVELANKISKDFKSFLRENKGDKEKTTLVKQKLDELEINIKELDETDVKVLIQLDDFMKTLK